MRLLGGLVILILGLGLGSAQTVDHLFYDEEDYPLIPEYGPQPNPPYMMDNRDNYYKVAPDKGKQNGPVWLESGSFESYMENARSARKQSSTAIHNETLIEWGPNITYAAMEVPSRAMAETGYWLPQLAGLGRQPIAGSDYKFYRDVTDYGAKGDGDTDDTEAINAAIEDGNRCGLECGNTFAQGAIIYFPPGTYKVCRPIIQLYYTQFIGDAIDLPTLKGCDEFQGIAIIDTDPYIPEGNGANWYINQNQFFRQIRNFKFDLKDMPLRTDDHDQPLVPTGIHWQVSQACSLQNLLFEMPDATDDNNVTHVGIFMENGSGGFVSDLTFRGGSIGWRAGSQQYTVINVKFENCLTAVQMIWDWGFNWQRVDIDGGAIGFNISGVGGIDGQGVGSISLIDSKITNCPIGILTRSGPNAPNIVIDNLEMSNVAAAIRDVNGNTILGSSNRVKLWALGKRYNGYEGTSTSGAVEAPEKSKRLLDSDGKLFYRPRPQYESFDAGQFRIATEHGCRNDGTGDNTKAINTFLREAQSASQIAYFPAGIYRVGGTVLIPTGSRVVGASWSQIQGAGAYFSDVFNPRVVVQVGQKGDVGTMEISDMIFNVQGVTAGAIVLEWNVHESSQGSAAMWDSHVRVGGATGSDLDIDTCPKFGFNEACICASMLFHITPQASGYFENVWIWLADHDNDMVVSDSPDKLINQISIYAARGTLIESEGPTWLYGTGSEHVVLYQYQLYGAKDVYLGHIQTETPYYQPVPVAPLPFEVGKAFPGDPSFEHCTTEGCKEAWGLRIINSEGITLHSAGMYSFFQEYYQDCLDTFDCQERICEVRGSKDVALFNVFTVGTVQVANGIDDGAILQADGNQRGFTTEISVWIPLEGDDDLNIVYVDPEVYEQSGVMCSPPCLLVFPTSSLSSSTTIIPGSYTTSLEYGAFGETTIGGEVVTTFITTTTTVTLRLDPVTTDGMQYSNINVTGGQTSSAITVSPSIDLAPVPVSLSDGEGGTTIRTVHVPPWPDVTRGPPENWGNPPGQTSGDVSGIFRTPFVTVVTASGPTVTTIRFPPTVSPISIECPPESGITFNTPRTTLTTNCLTSTDIVLPFACPSSRVLTFIGASTVTISADCTLSTVIKNDPAGPTDWIPGPSEVDEPDEPTITSEPGPLPTYTTIPIGQIELVEEDDDDDDDDSAGLLTPCNLWFFNICLALPGLRIRGLRWILPPGVYGPVGRDGTVTYPRESPTSCETATASFCATTLHETITTMPGTTSTSTRTESECSEFRACGATDLDTTTTRRPGSCSLPTQRARSERRMDTPEEEPESEFDPEPKRRIGPARRQTGGQPAQPGCPENKVVYPRNPRDTSAVRQILDQNNLQYTEVRSQSAGYTAFIRVTLLDAATESQLETQNLVIAIYEIFGSGGVDEASAFDDLESPDSLVHYGPLNADDMEMIQTSSHAVLDDATPFNSSTPVDKDGKALFKRASDSRTHMRIWHLSQDSMGLYTPNSEKNVWRSTISDSIDPVSSQPIFHFDKDADSNQVVYVVSEEGYWRNHPEFTTAGAAAFTRLRAWPEFGPGMESTPEDDIRFQHGSRVMAMIGGANLGICPKCNVRYVDVYSWKVGDSGEPFADRGERLLAQLVSALDEIVSEKLQSRAVINISSESQGTAGYTEAFYDILNFLNSQGAVIVAGAGNKKQTEAEKAPVKNPAIFSKPGRRRHIPNLITVAASDVNGYLADISRYADWITTFAPGRSVWVPDVTNLRKYSKKSGTSYAGPQVAGLAAYYRSMESPWKAQLGEVGEDGKTALTPGRVKTLIRKFHRRFNVIPEGNGDAATANDATKKRPVIWNGQYSGGRSCLRDYAINGQRTGWAERNCPDIDLVLDNQADDGETVAPCGTPSRRDLPGHAKRQDGGGSCPLLPPVDGSEGSGGGGAHTVSFTSGSTPSPTCTAASGCGGLVCTGFFCNPRATGSPPDKHDPKDPNGGSSVPTRTIGEPSGPTDPPNTCNDKCKLDRGNACECDENSCSADSPACCRNASCPMCNCGESGCSAGSPACCASGTCQWSWTGGGGGDGTGEPPGEGGGDGGGGGGGGSPPPSLPEAHRRRHLIFALQELSIPNTNGPWDWSRSWLVFSKEPDRQFILCDDRAVYNENTNTPSAMVGYPPSMSFDAVEGLRCSYEGSEGSVGKLSCPGISDIRCESLDELVPCGILNNPTIKARVYCSWG